MFIFLYSFHCICLLLGE